MYAKIKHGVALIYPYTRNNLQSENPSTELGEGDLATLFSNTEQGLAGAQLVQVTVQPRPVINELSQFLSYDLTNVTYAGGVWQQSWTTNNYDSATAAGRLETKRLELIEQVKALRDSRVISGGFKVMIDGVGRWVHSDTFSRTQWTMLARRADKIQQAGGDMSAVMQKIDNSGQLIWKMMGNSGYLPITPAIVLQIADSGELQDTKTFYQCEVLIATIKQHPVPTMINLNAGWPQIFGEPDPV